MGIQQAIKDVQAQPNKLVLRVKMAVHDDDWYRLVDGAWHWGWDERSNMWSFAEYCENELIAIPMRPLPGWYVLRVIQPGERYKSVQSGRILIWNSSSLCWLDDDAPRRVYANELYNNTFERVEA